MKQKILVTGGLGFIGSHTVVELVKEGFTPVVVDNMSNSHIFIKEQIELLTGQSLSFYEVDCCNEAALNRVFALEQSIEGCIHFAALKAVGESVANPLLYYYNNLLSTISLLNAMRSNGVENLIFSSSCTVYGEAIELPVTENTPVLQAASPYGNTKQVCEEMLADSAKAGWFKSIALRYFNPVGAHPSGKLGELPIGKPNNLVPFITQTAAGIYPELLVFGNDYPTPDGTCIRDYIHVVDLAQAHVAALRKLAQFSSGEFEKYNIGTGKGNSVLDMIRAFEKASGQKLNYRFAPRRPGDVAAIYADTKLSHQALKWKAAFTIEDMMLHAWQWQQFIHTRQNYLIQPV